MWRASVLAAWVLLAPPLAAQWSAGAEIGLLGFTGGGADTSAAGAGNVLRPSTGRTYALRVQRQGSTFGFGVSVLYSHTGVGAENDEMVVEAKGTMTLYEVAPEVFVVVARPGAGGALRLHAGALLDRWSLQGYEDRDRGGALAAASLDWPVAGPWTATFRAGVALGSSVFMQDELPDGFATRATWRRSIAAGLQLRL